METVNNLASSASRAIWGDTTKNNETAGTEPIAGETGNVAAGEPYDKGNEQISNNETGGREPIAGEKGDVGKGEPFDKGNLDSATEDTSTSLPTRSAPGNTPTTAPIRSEHETDKTGVTSHHNPTSAISSDKPTSSNDTSGPGPTPSVGADPSSAQQPASKQQGGERPEEVPEQGSAEHERIRETKREVEEAAGVDTSGPGPKSLEEKAREGGVGGDSKVEGGSGARAGDGEDGPQKESHGEGTGEKYIKSSGMKADGGDFDAANAGAGKEADRLLETKGIQHSPGAAPPKDEDTASSSKGSEKEGKEKVSLKDKIKAKLHKH